MMTTFHKCRCCGAQITMGKLACRYHWYALPRRLREAINSTWRGDDKASYAANIREAERLWQENGMWQQQPPPEATP